MLSCIGFQSALSRLKPVEDHEVHELKTLAERMGYGVKPNQPACFLERAEPGRMLTESH